MVSIEVSSRDHALMKTDAQNAVKQRFTRRIETALSSREARVGREPERGQRERKTNLPSPRLSLHPMEERELPGD
jgi:hypothetical protein